MRIGENNVNASLLDINLFESGRLASHEETSHSSHVTPADGRSARSWSSV